jgi:leader peptidase (prepilin peptidase)/N-methyltransferase
MDERQRLVLWVFSGLYGLLVGSFLNVCIFRLPRNCMSIRGPRSRCPGCSRGIAWYDNVPVLSWLLLRGRCRHCGRRISPRYVLVELLTGVLLAWAGWRALYGSPGLTGMQQALKFAVESSFVSALLVSAFIDLEFRILPDEITLRGLAVGLGVSALWPFLHPEAGRLVVPGTGLALTQPHLVSLGASAIGALAGGGTLYVVGVFGKLAFRKRIEALGETEAMGLGDVKFMAMAGSILGWRAVLLSLVLACVGGSLVGLLRLLVARRMGYVPFGPFLSLGALAMLYLGPWVDLGVRLYMDAVNRLAERLLS